MTYAQYSFFLHASNFQLLYSLIILHKFADFVQNYSTKMSADSVWPCSKAYSVVNCCYLDDKEWSSGLLYTLIINVVSVQESSSQNSLEQHVCCKDCDIPCHGTNTEEVHQKISGVLGTNAVVNPHTMMVKSVDTSIANACKNKLTMFTVMLITKKKNIIK